MFGKRKILGLALSSGSCTAVEVVAADGGRVARAGRLAFPDGVGLDNPGALGRALKQFLREQGFTASQCVIGVDAAWLTARSAPIPPGAGGVQVRDILSLTIEREFASDREGLVFDYALGPGDRESQSALLVAAPQAVVDQAAAMAKAAGLSPLGVTAATLALAEETNGSTGPNELVLHLFGEGTELALRSEGALRALRRLTARVPADLDARATSNGWLTELAEQLRRIVALLPTGEAQDAAGYELVVWDEAALDADAWRTVSERLGLPVRLSQRPAGLEAKGGPDASVGAPCSAAAVMAMNALHGRAMIVDLLHSRLVPAKRSIIGRRGALAVAAGVVICVAGALSWWDAHTSRQEVASLQTRLDEMSPDLDAARSIIDKVTFARPWSSRKPHHLECVRELTLAFPQEGIIWTTSLAVQEDLRVVFSGKAVSESAVLDVLDRLKANRRFTDVQPLYIRQASKDGRKVAFAMSFTFNPSGPT